MPIPTIDALPDPPDSADILNFDARGDAFLGALPDMVTQTNAAISGINAAAGQVGDDAEAAADSAQAADTARGQAATARDQSVAAAGTVQAFYVEYLGPKASDPTTDNAGGALIAGALYFNTVAKEMRAYDGALWAAAYLPATGYATTAALAITNANLSALAGITYYDMGIT